MVDLVLQQKKKLELQNTIARLEKRENCALVVSLLGIILGVAAFFFHDFSVAAPLLSVACFCFVGGVSVGMSLEPKFAKYQGELDAIKMIELKSRPRYQVTRVNQGDILKIALCRTLDGEAQELEAQSF